MNDSSNVNQCCKTEASPRGGEIFLSIPAEVSSTPMSVSFNFPTVFCGFHDGLPYQFPLAFLLLSPGLVGCGPPALRLFWMGLCFAMVSRCWERLLCVRGFSSPREGWPRGECNMGCPIVEGGKEPQSIKWQTLASTPHQPTNQACDTHLVCFGRNTSFLAHHVKLLQSCHTRHN